MAEEKQVISASVNKTKSAYTMACPDCTRTLRVAMERGTSRRTCWNCKTKWRVSVDLNQKPDGTPDVEVTVDGRTTKVPKTVHATVVATSRPKDKAITPEMVEKKLEGELEAVRGRYLKELRDEAIAAARAELKKLETKEVVLQVNTLPRGQKRKKLEGKRPAIYEDVMEALTACGQAMLVGPSGSGKSYLARMIANDLGYDFLYYACSEGLNEAHLLGRMDVHGKYIPSPLVTAIEKDKPCVILFDEVDAMDANIGVAVNEFTNSRELSLPNRPTKPIVKGSMDKHLVLWGGNTWGTGTSVEYTGRNQLDAASLDRFVGVQFFVDYDPDVEAGLAAEREVDPFHRVMTKVRTNCREHRVKRVVSMRAIINLGNLHRLNPEKYTTRKMVDRFFVGWSDQEKAKALMGIDLDNLDGKPEPQQQKGSGKTGPDCPTCGKPMRVRRSTKGRFAGKEFWGCSDFPRCTQPPVPMDK